ncbi:MAG TPA: hypothetical protein VKZ53_07245 [Candidatus Angelobacter sp.]|nr:hypothetical protein [Candidatus Angelobacter sp.]
MEKIQTGLAAPNRMKVRIKILLGLACCLGLTGFSDPQARHELGDVVLVVNGNVPVANLSLFDARHIFMGEQHYWNSNLPVVLIVPPAGTRQHDVMLHTLYRMNSSQYRQYWIGRIFRGEAISPPKTAESSEIANALVSSLGGCITIMNSEEVRPGSKVLRINGKFPGERGYPLR